MNGDAKEEVRSRLNIEDVIGEYVVLKRAGRSWKGLSPFSGEKSPSFFVSPDKQIWHDFSSNKGGDVYSFVMEVEGLDFRGALELLARKAGVDLSMYESKGSQDLSRKKSRLLAALSEAADFYQRRMLHDASAKAYVVEARGLNRQMVEDFKIGYAPGAGDELTRYLLNKNFTRQELKDAGLIGSRGTDMFRNRMTVALADGSGQTIGFTARLLGDGNGPKYINTPQTLVYDKGRHVFGLHLAKEAIRSNDFAVVVEGNMDVIASHQVGVRQVVATAGTALTEFHLKALSRLTHNIRLSFDGDRAGIAATERAIPIAQTVGVELSVISYEDAKDPDELIKKDPTLWERAITHAKPALEWLIDQYAARVDLDSAAGKRELTNNAFTILSKVTDPIEQEHYIKQIARKTDISETALNNRLQQFDYPQEAKLKPVKTQVTESDKDEYIYQDYLLALMALDRTVIDVVKKLSIDDIHGEVRQRLFGYLLEHPGRIGEEVPLVLKDIETYVKIVIFKAETRYEDLDGQDRLVEAVKLVRQIKEQKRKHNKQALTAALRDAEARDDVPEATRLRVELNELIKEEARANRSYKR